MKNLIQGYKRFREVYSQSYEILLKDLYKNGQNPKAMIVACCDSRVDPAVLLQCDPGDLFVLRNLANIVPPYECDNSHHHGTSAALELGVNKLKVKHLIILGHSDCSGIDTWLQNKKDKSNNLEEYFTDLWLNIIDIPDFKNLSLDECVKKSLENSYQNSLTFPWIRSKVENGDIIVHRWFFDIKRGIIEEFVSDENRYVELSGDY